MWNVALMPRHTAAPMKKHEKTKMSLLLALGYRGATIMYRRRPVSEKTMQPSKCVQMFTDSLCNQNSDLIEPRYEFEDARYPDKM
jgi:hypothetical protein